MYSNIQFSCSVVSNSLWPHGLQHARPPCPSPTPGVYPNSCPLSRWCHPTISSSVVPFSSRLQSFPASGSFQMSQFFPSGGPSVEVSASALILPMNTQDWSLLEWTGWISAVQSNIMYSYLSTFCEIIHVCPFISSLATGLRQPSLSLERIALLCPFHASLSFEFLGQSGMSGEACFKFK